MASTQKKEARSKEGNPSPAQTAPSKPKSPPEAQFQLPSNIAFYLCLLSNVLAAFYAPIQDCDEVYNYWEPTHYLRYGYGRQTWEYSPEYTIRSWFYVAIHAVLGTVASSFQKGKTFEFYLIRVFLALACSACQTRLFSTISHNLNPRIGLFFLVIMAFSPGMFHASVAYLPSSFTMYTSMLGMSAFMDWRGGSRTVQGIVWFGIGSIIGWPFAGILILPFLLEDFVISAYIGRVEGALLRFLAGGIGSLFILAFEVGIDSLFFRKLAIVPWNIVSYNVLSGNAQGPNIFGTEPWHFYVRNLLLNFNVWFILAILSAPLLVWQYVFRRQTTTKQTLIRTSVAIMPFYLWFGIFTLQPHKEERFMYPAYPFLVLNAAISLHMVLAYLGSNDPNEMVGKIPAKLKLLAVSTTVLLAINAGLLRTIGITTAYRAPLQVYQQLESADMVHPGDNLCVGKEWYRFPSSYFLPNNMHVKFIKNEFTGLLPGEFHEDQPGDVLAGTWMVPQGMNDRNEEDLGKYVDISNCTFVVDSHFPSAQPSALEPEYVLDTSTWEEVICKEFLDSQRTGILGRTLWVPDVLLPEGLQRKWGRYCLLRRRKT